VDHDHSSLGIENQDYKSRPRVRVGIRVNKDDNAVGVFMPPSIIYKFLFTKKTVATQKHGSTSTNTNKAKTTKTKSITVVDTLYWSINIIYYTGWAKKPDCFQT